MLQAKKSQHEADNVQLFRCLKCGWKRFFDQTRETDVYVHNDYGLVTYKEAARKDIYYHDCAKHIAAKDRALKAALWFKANYIPHRLRVQYDWRQPVRVRQHVREPENDSGNMGAEASSDNAGMEERS